MIKMERISTFVQWKSTVKGVANNPDLFFCETDTVELEGTHNYSPNGQLCQLQMNRREWSVGRRFQSKKHKTSVCLLSSEIHENGHRYSVRSIGKDSMMKPRMISSKQQ